VRRTRKPNVVLKKGTLYYRKRWTEAGKRKEAYIPLPKNEHSKEFDAAYWAIRSGRDPAMKRKVKTTWAALVASYKASPRYTKLAAGTKRKYDSVLKQIVEKNGDKDMRKVTRQEIRAIHAKYADTPRTADLHIQVLRILLKWAEQELEWISKNPAMGIELFGPQKEFKPWPEAAQKAYRSASSAQTDDIALTFFMLGTGTGQRAEDCCQMRWDQYDGEFIEVIQDKTKEQIWVACPAFLREYLDNLPKRGRYIMPKNFKEPLGYNVVFKRFEKVREAAGEICKGLVPHGWRFTAAVALAEAGCSDAEIQSVTGHRTLKMVQKYRAQANQKRLSKQAQAKRDAK
jgi:integrase